MDNHISFVAITNKKGRVEESQGRNDIIGKLSSARKEMFFMENALVHRMEEEFNEDFSKMKFIYLARDNNSLLSFPIGDQLLLVSFAISNIDFYTLSRDIIHQINIYKKKIEGHARLNY